MLVVMLKGGANEALGFDGLAVDGVREVAVHPLVGASRGRRHPLLSVGESGFELGEAFFVLVTDRAIRD